MPFLNQRKGENDCRKYFTINLHGRMLPTSAGVEPATSWSPVGWCIQLSNPGRHNGDIRKIFCGYPVLSGAVNYMYITLDWMLFQPKIYLVHFLVSVAQLDARPTGDQEVVGSTPAEVGNILSWRLIMKYFLRSFSPFRWFKKGSCQFLAKECA